MATTIKYQRVKYLDSDGLEKACGHTHTSDESAGVCARTVVRKLMRDAFPLFPSPLRVALETAEVAPS